MPCRSGSSCLCPTVISTRPKSPFRGGSSRARATTSCSPPSTAAASPSAIRSCFAARCSTCSARRATRDEFYDELRSCAGVRRARSPGSRSSQPTTTRCSCRAVTRRGCASTSGTRRSRRRSPRSFELDRPVAAICHGVLVLARSQAPATGKSVLAAREPRACRSSWSAARTSRRACARSLLPHVPRLRRGRGPRRARDPERQFQRGPMTLVRARHRAPTVRQRVRRRGRPLRVRSLARRRAAPRRAARLAAGRRALRARGQGCR